MPRETLILVGRNSAAAVEREHAGRLREREIADTVRDVRDRAGAGAGRGVVRAARRARERSTTYARDVATG